MTEPSTASAELPSTGQTGPRRERDPGACERCNCHHHTTEEHDRRSREGVPDFGMGMEDW